MAQWRGRAGGIAGHFKESLSAASAVSGRSSATRRGRMVNFTVQGAIDVYRALRIKHVQIWTRSLTRSGQVDETAHGSMA